MVRGQHFVVLDITSPIGPVVLDGQVREDTTRNVPIVASARVGAVPVDRAVDAFTLGPTRQVEARTSGRREGPMSRARETWTTCIYETAERIRTVMVVLDGSSYVRRFFEGKSDTHRGRMSVGLDRGVVRPRSRAIRGERPKTVSITRTTSSLLAKASTTVSRSSKVNRTGILGGQLMCVRPPRPAHSSAPRTRPAAGNRCSSQGHR
jgi:hypothetical protein